MSRIGKGLLTFWCLEQGSNLPRRTLQDRALPTELSRHNFGAQDGSWTRKTLILRQVSMPVRLLGRTGTRKGTRTPNPQIRNLLHYPVVLYGHICHLLSHSQVVWCYCRWLDGERFSSPVVSEKATRYLVSPEGVEPSKPASLAQYLCQFGYEDIFWWRVPDSNRHLQLERLATYSISRTRHRKIRIPYLMCYLIVALGIYPPIFHFPAQHTI